MEDATRSSNIVGPVDAGWTVVTLKEYVDTLSEVGARDRTTIRSHYDTLLTEYDRRYAARFVASEQAVKDAFAAQEKAISKADTANEKRFESVNEFRAQLGDQQRTFMPRSESEALIKGLSDRLEAGIRSLSEKVDANASRMDRRDAAGVGSQQVWGYVAAAVGVMVGIAGLVLALFR